MLEKTEKNDTANLRFTRRELFKKIGKSALGLKVFSYPQEALANETGSENEKSELETIQITNDGWNFIVDLDQLKTYTSSNQSEVGMKLEGGYGTKTSQIFYKNGQSEATSNYIRVSPQGKTLGIMEILPNIEKNEVTLIREEKKDGKILKRDNHPVYLETYGFVPEDKNDPQRIWSEVKLDNSILEKLHEQTKRFNLFPNSNYPTFIFKPRYGIQTPLYNPEDNFIMIPQKYFAAEDTFPQGIIVLEHERFHAAHKLNHSQAKKADQELKKAHEEVWISLTGEPPSLGTDIFTPPEIREHPCFALFDESTYFPELKKIDVQDHGHPFSNHREFFASALNCMDKAADQMITQIGVLDDEEIKAMLKKLSLATIELAQSLIEDQTLFEEYFPGIQNVKSSFY